MMERSQRLYDCITDIGDAYLQDVEHFRPAAKVQWRRWGSLAAALILIVGLGRWASDNLRMGSNSSSTASSAPTAAAENESLDTQAGGDYYTYGDYAEMAQAADVIVETAVTGITPDVPILVNDDGEGQSVLLPYTVINLEILDVLKGDVEPGETIQLKIPEQEDGGGIQAEVGEQSICFLRDYRGEDPDMPFSALNPNETIIAIEADSVRLKESVLGGANDVEISMEKEAFKDLIRQALAEN